MAVVSPLQAFGRLRIVVGKVLSARVHENADTMYVEDIDIGGEKPLQVCSGIRRHIALDDFVGLKILVVANMKSAKLRGVNSMAMILCAKTPDGDVEVLRVDEQVPVGERLTCDGAEGEPDLQLNPKHKVWQTVADTNAFAVGQDGLVCFDGRPLRTAAGVTVRSASPPGSTIS